MTEATAGAAPRRFPDHERRWLLSMPGLGPHIVQRLEGEGLAPLRVLQTLGAQGVVERIGRGQGAPCWRNRRRALDRALQAAALLTQPVADAASPRGKS